MTCDAFRNHATDASAPGAIQFILTPLYERGDGGIF